MQHKRQIALSCILGTTFALACLRPSHAQEPIGAARFLKALEEQSRQQKANAYSAFTKEIQVYTQRVGTLSPQEATAQWMKLLDRYYEMMKSERGGGYTNFSIMVEALPPPSAWDTLINAIRNRKSTTPLAKKRDTALKMFASVLEGNQARILQESKDLEKSFPDRQMLDVLPNIQELLTVKDEAMLGQKTERILKRLRERMKQEVQGNAQRERFGRGRYGREGFDVGDLVSEINVLRTAPFLKEIFTTVPLEFSFPPNTKTFELAQRVVMENIDQLQRPQWQLAATPNNIALYEAMERKFPPPKILKKPAPPKDNEGMMPDAGDGEEMPFSSTQRSALNFYLTSLIQKGKTQQATARLEQEGTLENNGIFTGSMGFYYPSRYSAQMGMHSSQEDQKKIFQVLKTVLQKNPKLGYWKALLNYGRMTHQLPQLQSLFLQAAKQPNITPSLRGEIESGVYTIYLYKDQVEEAVGLLKSILARPKPKRSRRNYYDYASMMGSLDPVSNLMTLGQLCDHPEWIQEALKHSKRKSNNDYAYYRGGDNLTETLIESGRYALAEQNLWESVSSEEGQGNGSSIVQSLMPLYHKMKRYSDILLLLDRYPDWDQTDLIDLQGRNDSFGYYTANALSKVGRNSEAIPILEHILRSHATEYGGGGDTIMEAIELFVELQGAKASPYFDKLLAVKPEANEFLYGKALISLKAGKIKEAEEQATTALAPYLGVPSISESEALPITRLLQKIADQLKQPQEKETYSKLERAFLLMGQANRYSSAELTPRATKCAKEAFALAPNLACVRQMMAQQAEEAGQTKEAEDHYQALVEGTLSLDNPKNPRNMPISRRFNWRMMMRYYESQMEQEEGGSLSTRVQERIYTSLLSKEPKNAKYAYLLATIRIQQQRFGDAVKLLQQATTLDPNLDPAWRALLGLAEKSPLPIPDQEGIALRLFQSSHSTGRDDDEILKQVHDLKRLWKSAETFQNLRLPALPQSLYVLREAKFRKQMSNREENDYEDYYNHRHSGDYGVPTPAQAIAQHPLISAVTSLMDYMRYATDNNEEENGDK